MGKDYDYLDEERRKLWHRVNSLETELNKRSSDYTDEARQSSRKASEFRNKSEESKNTISQFLNDISAQAEEIKLIFDSVNILNTNIKNYYNDATIDSSATKEIKFEIEERKSAIERQILELEAIFEGHAELVSKIDKIEETLTRGNDTASKIETLHKSLLVRKKRN